MELEALFDAVIVKPQEEEETTYGSIVVPEQLALERKQLLEPLLKLL